MDATSYFSNNKSINPTSIKVSIEAEIEANFRLINAPLLPGSISDRVISITGASLVDAQRWVANKPGKHLLLETNEGVLDIPCRIANSGQVALLSTRLSTEGSPIEAYYASQRSDVDYAHLVAQLHQEPPTKTSLDEHFDLLVKVRAITSDKESGDLWFSSIGQGRYQLSQLVSQLHMASKLATRKLDVSQLDLVADAFGEA